MSNATNIESYGYECRECKGLEGQITQLQAENEKFRDVLTAIKIRIAFIGWPSEKMNEEGRPDWVREIALIEQALKGK